MTEHQAFMAAMEAIEEADRYEGEIKADFGDAEVWIDIEALIVVAEQYRKLEKERDELQEKLDKIKSITEAFEDL